MRAREIRDIRTLILEGESVRLVAPRGTGRTYLLDQIAQELEALGYSAVRVTGRRPFQNQPYVALREAGLVELRGAHSESDVVQELTQELAPAARPVFLVDDAESMDLSSAYVIEQLRRRRGIPLVLVAPPFVMLDAHGRAVTGKIHTKTRVELAPLGYTQINVLAQRVLGAPAQPEVVAQVLAMSSGMTGIAVAILQTAAREHQIVQHESGWALHETTLWNVHLRGTVEQLLAGLTRDEFRALHALALAESADTEAFHRVAGAELIGLTQRGLLTTFAGEAGGTQIAPRPSVITDYFHHQPVDPLHYEALGLLESLEDPAARERASARSRGQVRRAQTFDLTENLGTGKTRFDHADVSYRLASAARDWRREASTAHAVAYLNLLLSTDNYLTGAATVLKQTPRSGAGTLGITLGMHHAFWITQSARGDFRAQLREFVAAEADSAARIALEAFEAYLRFCRFGLEPEVSRWWEDARERRDGFSVAVGHFIGVVSGQIDEPLSTDLLDPEFEFESLVVGTANTVLRSRNATPEVYEEELRVAFAAARAASDYRRVAVGAYFLAQQEAATFRDFLATETVNVTLALGTPNLAFAHYFSAQLRWAAYLHYVQGEPDLARSVLAEAARYPGIHGPLPAMHPAFGTAIQHLIAGEVDRGVALLLHTSAVCDESQLGDAAWTYAVVAFSERPTEEVYAQLQRVAAGSSHGTEALMQLVRGALDADPELPLAAQWLTQDAEISTAVSLLTAVYRCRRASSASDPDRFTAVLAETVRELRGLLGNDASSVVSERPDTRGEMPLTKREREIALLAVTLHNREIADRLSLSVRTVENHLARAMKKLGVGSRAELASSAGITS